MGLKENQEMAEKYPILQFFQYNHLPEHLRKVSAPFCNLAWRIAREIPGGAEKQVALRKLLESKDAAVRAAIDVQAVLIPDSEQEMKQSEVVDSKHPYVPGYPRPSGEQDG